eukprot:12885488-Prorocentrum_lima.AAC.1
MSYLPAWRCPRCRGAVHYPCLMTSLHHPATQPPRCPLCRFSLVPGAQTSFTWGEEERATPEQCAGDNHGGTAHN